MKNFMTGVVFGFLGGVMLSPRSGRETRAEIGSAYQEIRDRLAEEMSRLKEITQETYEQVVDSLTSAYLEASRITSREAAAIRKELRSGYERMKQAHLEVQKRHEGAPETQARSPRMKPAHLEAKPRRGV